MILIISQSGMQGIKMLRKQSFLACRKSERFSSSPQVAFT